MAVVHDFALTVYIMNRTDEYIRRVDGSFTVHNTLAGTTVNVAAVVDPFQERGDQRALAQTLWEGLAVG